MSLFYVYVQVGVYPSIYHLMGRWAPLQERSRICAFMTSGKILNKNPYKPTDFNLHLRTLIYVRPTNHTNDLNAKIEIE